MIRIDSNKKLVKQIEKVTQKTRTNYENSHQENN